MASARRGPCPRRRWRTCWPPRGCCSGPRRWSTARPSESRLAAFIGIKEYPTPTSPGVLNRLLTAPFPFVLTQSFAFLPKSTAQGLLSRQYHRMTNAGDLAVSQAEALKAALDQLSGNEFVMGDHHLTLQVLTEPVAAEDASYGGGLAACAERERGAGADLAGRDRDGGGARGPRDGGRVLGAAAGELRVSTAQGADHQSQLRGTLPRSTTFRSDARWAITGARRSRCLRRRRARPITSRCTRAIRARRTAVRGATPGTRSSADRRARGRPCSLGSVWRCSRRPAPRKSSSTRTAGSRSWCGHWAVRTRRSSSGSRPASIRSPCPTQPLQREFLRVWLRALVARAGSSAHRARGSGPRAGLARHAGAGAGVVATVVAAHRVPGFHGRGGRVRTPRALV